MAIARISESSPPPQNIRTGVRRIKLIMVLAKIMGRNMRNISWLCVLCIHYSFSFIKKGDSTGTFASLPLLCIFIFLPPVDQLIGVKILAVVW